MPTVLYLDGAWPGMVLSCGSLRTDGGAEPREGVVRNTEAEEALVGRGAGGRAVRSNYGAGEMGCCSLLHGGGEIGAFTRVVDQWQGREMRYEIGVRLRGGRLELGDWELEIKVR